MRGPNLCFWNLQLANKPEDRDQVVILFQDMLEVVTRDIMMEDQISRCGIFVIGLFKHICIWHHIVMSFYMAASKFIIYCFFLWSLVDSIHGGSGHEGMTLHEQQYQLFASSGAIKFPIDPVTEAWKEKVCFVNRDLLINMKLDKHANLNSSSLPVFAD